jgi:hypothetical protein
VTAPKRPVGRPRIHPERTPGPHGGRRKGAGRPPGPDLADGERLTVRVPGALLARVDARAESDGVGRSDAVRAALELYAPPAPS